LGKESYYSYFSVSSIISYARKGEGVVVVLITLPVSQEGLYILVTCEKNVTTK